MRRRLRLLRRRAAVLVLAVLIAAPEIALATGQPLDSMSQAELDRYVQQINQDANWRKFRRPNDPPDFVPGKPVKVMYGAGAKMGRGGTGARAFRKSGLGQRRSGLGGSRRRGGRDDQTAMDRGRGSSNSGLGSSSRSRSGSSSNRSSFGNSSRSSFGNQSGMGLDQ